MNKKISEHIIKHLLLQGVKDFCICAGGRNIPLISTLTNLQKELTLNFYEFFDERSASFFALGRVKSVGRPVVVITTSGTAVAETLPAMLEAKYSNTPLVVLSADRPKTYREHYTPQTMKHMSVFNSIEINQWDLDKNNFIDFNFSDLKFNQTHINICFDDLIIFCTKVPSFLSELKNASVPKSEVMDNAMLSMEDSVCLSQFFSQSKKPAVLVSKLGLKYNKDLINLLLKLNTFVYLEADSKLKGERKLELLTLKAGEKSLKQVFDKKLFDSIIKIGSTPTLKFWRLLETDFNHIPVLSITEHGGSGLSRVKKTLNLAHFLNTVFNASLSSVGVFCPWGSDNLWKAEVRKLDDILYKDKNTEYEKNSFSEKSLIKKMSEVFAKEDNIFLGNSLSIRNWNSMAVNKPFLSIESHRGLNGIDGLVSGFLGWVSGMSGKNKSWAILGDLSALYDLNSLWINKQLENKNWAIIIVNNSGGKIFKPLFNQKILEARHDLNFQHWAKMFNCPYVKIEAKDFSSQFNKDLKGVIEIIPEKN